MKAYRGFESLSHRHSVCENRLSRGSAVQPPETTALIQSIPLPGGGSGEPLGAFLSPFQPLVSQRLTAANTFGAETGPALFHPEKQGESAENRVGQCERRDRKPPLALGRRAGAAPLTLRSFQGVF